MAFARHGKNFGIMHHRALGRRAFVQAARTVDRQLTEISGSYDFLLDLILKGRMEGHTIVPGDLVLFASVGAGMHINAVVYRF